MQSSLSPLSTTNDTIDHNETGNSDPLLTRIPSKQFLVEDLPHEFAYPHFYKPHPVAVWAAEQLKTKLSDPSCSAHLGNFGRMDGVMAPIRLAPGVTATSNRRPPTPASSVGKMFGVLVVRLPSIADSRGEISNLGYLAAFSGTLPGARPEDGFCPLVYDRWEAQNAFYPEGENELNAMTARIRALEESPDRSNRRALFKTVEAQGKDELAAHKALQKEKKKQRKRKRDEFLERSPEGNYQALDEELKQEGAALQREFKKLKESVNARTDAAKDSLEEIENEIIGLKETRAKASAELQNRLFASYSFLDTKGNTESLLPLFEDTPYGRPPGGAGDCAAPKLLQWANQRGYEPLAMAEFWWGASPSNGECRRHGLYYPACRGKCQPILAHMLRGIRVQANPLEEASPSATTTEPVEPSQLDILFEDDHVLIIHKPEGVLSVPGKTLEDSIYSRVQSAYPNATGPLLVHRLDLSTSGILLVAKTKSAHKTLSAQFIERTVTKRYAALLEGAWPTDKPRKGEVDLPLVPDYENRPMQKVAKGGGGKPARTVYEVVGEEEAAGIGGKTHHRSRILFYPLTGRTHQLRVHAAHPEGLDLPIVGDDIYGTRDKRLCLHAEFLEFEHPATGERVSFHAPVPF